METLQFLQDFGGLIVGVLLLIVASMVLPGKVRVYVLTAGLAVIAYEAYQRITNKKRMQEADRERERLQQRAGELEQRGKELAAKVEELNKKLSGMQAEKEKLDQQAGALNARGAELAKEKDRLERETEAVLKNIHNGEGALALIEETRAAFRELE
ncbi:hypothetical protein JXA70_11050 [candidate division KSB1 bacterium]|nr:hypothetical protein [candidate division KSB1 bacterium]